MGRSRMAVLLGAAAVLSACSIVRESRVREDWGRVDRQRLKRLVVVTQPLPEGKEKVGELWSAIAARYVDLKRDFIIRDRLARAGDAFSASDHCADQIEGVLWLDPDVKRSGEGVEAEVEGRLFRCADGEEVWFALAGGSWNSQDPKLTQTVEDYVSEFGEEVRPYVVASYRLLQDTLDTLPNPVLTEEDQMDKIEHSQ